MKLEKLGYRDLRYNNWHRPQNKKCPSWFYMFDIDFIEYDSRCQEKALIELKHGSIKVIDLDSFQMKCQTNTAKKLGVPYFVVVYYPTEMDEYSKCENQFGEEYQFYVIPINQMALDLLPEDTQMTEAMYVSLLARCRNEELPEGLELDNTYIDIPIPVVVR